MATKECKIIFPSSYILASFDGITKIERQGTSETWDAKLAASEAAKAFPQRPSEEQLKAIASAWQDSFEAFFSKTDYPKFQTAPGEVIVQLLLLARSTNGSLVKINASFSMVDGLVHRNDIYSLKSPTNGSTDVKVNGSCGSFKAKGFRLSESEMTELARFSDYPRKPINKIEDLESIGLSYETFASSVSGRIANETGRVADVAGPYDFAFLDLGQNRWTLRLSNSGCIQVPK